MRRIRERQSLIHRAPLGEILFTRRPPACSVFAPTAACCSPFVVGRSCGVLEDTPIELTHLPLIPAEAGIQVESADTPANPWVPAFAGTSARSMRNPSRDAPRPSFVHDHVQEDFHAQERTFSHRLA